MKIREFIAFAALSMGVLVASSLNTTAVASPVQSTTKQEGKRALLAIHALPALKDEEIQAEVELSRDQKDAVAAIAARLAHDIESRVNRARRNPLRTNVGALRREAGDLLKKADSEAIALLDETQKDRLRRASARLGGSLAAANPLVQSSLDLSTDQRKQIEDAIGGLPRGKREERGERETAEAIKRAQGRIEQVLTPEQRRKLASLATATLDETAAR
jgi:Spy/CpxP family protein refolding chaperone